MDSILNKKKININKTEKKLFVTIPIDLYGIIFARKDLYNIDEIVTELLCKHYGVELNGNTKDNKQ